MLNMRAEDVRNRVCFHELHQAVRACGIRRNLRLGDPQPSGIQAIAGHQIAGETIVQRDARNIMARKWDHIDHAIA